MNGIAKFPIIAHRAMHDMVGVEHDANVALMPIMVGIDDDRTRSRTFDALQDADIGTDVRPNSSGFEPAAVEMSVEGFV
ncbi:hypothetical protein C3941_09565 [Kaistia algarum]|nr:hypothetical protein C3941_09565 [Kaistia algarum]